MKQMKDFKTKTELYAEYVRLMEKYEPEPVIKKPVIVKKPVIKKPVIKKPVIKKKELPIWCSMETFELEKAGVKRRRENFLLQDMEKADGFEMWKKNKEYWEKQGGNRCVKCDGVFDLGYAPLCPNCYEKFGYYNIEGNGANFKKFLGKDAEPNGFNRVLPKGKCLIKI